MKNDIKDAYMIVLLRRISPSKDENVGLTKKCIRKIVHSDDTIEDTVEYLKGIVNREPGIWRFYRTVNKRNFEKGRKVLMKDLIDRPEELEYKIDTHWKSIVKKNPIKIIP